MQHAAAAQAQEVVKLKVTIETLCGELDRNAQEMEELRQKLSKSQREAAGLRVRASRLFI
jgi:molecular chaperone GrpE (heat shock protein)